MTRARFLALAAALPALGVRRARAQRSDATPSPLPASGSLLVTVTGYLNGEELDLLLVDPRNFSQTQLVSGRGLAYAVAPDRSALYTVSGALSLQTTEFGQEPWWRHSIAYPKDLAPESWSLALSPDGGWLYTFINRFHRAPPSVGNDYGAGSYETVVCVFDVQAGNFLPKTASLPQSGGTGGYDPTMFIAGDSRCLDAYYPARGVVHRHCLSGAGAIASTAYILPPAGWVRSPDASPIERCTVRDVTYVVHGDGLVLVAEAGKYRVGKIEPLPKDRAMLPPAVSLDGKLLFVPTGPGRAGQPRYAERIAVYETGGFSKVRELESQRPLGPMAANQDGSRLYAMLPETTSIAVLNGTSLWEERLLRFIYPAVRGLTVIP